MQAMLPAGMPRMSVAEGRARNGNGTSEPMSTRGRKCASPLRRSARNTIGGMPTPPPSSSVRGRSRWATNGWPIGPEHAHRVAGLLGPERVQARAHDLVEDLDPAGLRVRAHDRQRAAHRDAGIAGEVREGAGRGVRGALGRAQADDELLGVVGELREHRRLLEEDGAAVFLAHRAPPRAAEHLGQHRHAHRDAVAHLVADHRLRPVGHLGGDLDAAVHRLRVHHDGIRARQPQPLRGEPPGAEVRIALGQVRLSHALLLDAQHHDDVAAGEPRGEIAVARGAGELVGCPAAAPPAPRSAGPTPRACAARARPSARRASGGCRRRSPPRVPRSAACSGRWSAHPAGPASGARRALRPADSTLTCGATCAATSPGTPASASRITKASTCSDSSV